MKTKKIDLNTLGAKLRRAKLAAGLSLSLTPSTIVHKDKHREASKKLVVQDIIRRINYGKVNNDNYPHRKI